MTEETETNNAATPAPQEPQSEPQPEPAAVVEPKAVAFEEPAAPPAKEEEQKTDEAQEEPSAPSPATPEKKVVKVLERSGTPPPILTTSGKKRPPYTYDPKKITLRFIFANRDGLAVTIECRPADTIGEIKGALLSVWPDELPNCSGGDRVRLVCMGKGILMPDTRTLVDCEVPVFKTHPTPVNVSVKPENMPTSSEKTGSRSANHSSSNGNNAAGSNSTSQGCACAIL